MELPVNEQKLDSLGAHFKYKDLCLKLQNGQQLQDLRSQGLLQYQHFYSTNEPVILTKQKDRPLIEYESIRISQLPIMIDEKESTREPEVKESP